MFFDDRLATVLRNRATSEAGARTQFRQLLDILGNRKFAVQDERSGSLLAAAWLRMDALAEEIPAAQRAKMIREPGWRFRNPELAAHLAEHEPEVASAALGRANLTPEDWDTLIPRLPVRARGFMRLRRDLPVDTEKILERLGVHDRGLPSPSSDSIVPAPDAAGTPSEEQLEELNPAADPQSDPTEQETQPPVGFAPRVSPNAQPRAPIDPDESGRSEISALVERIAQFQRERDTGPIDADRSPTLPLGLPPEDAAAGDKRISYFSFASDANGRIFWAESEVEAMVIGTRLARPPLLGAQAGDNPLKRAFSRRQPISQAIFELRGAPAIAGDWVVDAQPHFTDDGNFSGYLGRFRRPVEDGSAASSPAAREADRIRQLLHELRTPVTAIQGYAEVIQQQLFGPAPHEYRALAAAIAADAARVLAGFEELDRLAKLETGAIQIMDGETDLTALVENTCQQLGQVLSARMAGIDLEDAPDNPVIIALDSEDTEVLIWRLLATLGGSCSMGETLGARLTLRASEACFTCELPAQLMAEDNIFAAEVKPVGTAINAGIFGAGFALRLVRAEARAAGGSLSVGDETVALALPLLTGDDALLSDLIHGGSAETG